MKGTFAALALFFSAVALAQGGGKAPLQLIEKGQLPQPSVAEPSAVGPHGAEDQLAMIQRYGTVVNRRPLGAGGLTAWTVEKGGRQVVLYTTADGQAVISGVVWDSLSGKNLSDQVVLGPKRAALPGVGASAPPPREKAVVGQPRPGALVGKYAGPVPESIATIDSLVGVKEGNGSPADTLYIVFDPRCPYCRKAYTFTREYVKRGFTIKWIPAVVLGNPPQGNALVATILQAKPTQQQDALQRVLGRKEEVATEPTKATIATLERNSAFFFAAFQNNRVEQAGVPAAFFLDKRSGKPRMMTGISEMPVIEDVFGKL